MNLSQLGRGRSLEMIVPALPVIVSQSVIALIIKNFIFVARRDGICIEPSRISGSLLLSMKKKWISGKHHQGKHPFKPLIFSSSRIGAANIPPISSISISFLYAPSLYSLFPRCQTETPLPPPLIM